MYCTLEYSVETGLFSDRFSKHVLTEDVLERYIRDDGKLYTIKMLTKTNPMPRWGERFYKGPKFVTIIEETIVDPDTSTFTSYSRNITMTHFMVSDKVWSSFSLLDVKASACWMSKSQLVGCQSLGLLYVRV